MLTRIRPAQPADAPAIARIYNLGIAGRQATFETRPRSPEEIAAWLEDGLPTLVAERDGTAERAAGAHERARRGCSRSAPVAGFARLTAYSDRCVYEGVGEYGIYVDADARGAGVGTALLEALAGAAEAAGYYKLTSKLFTSNQASLALARRCGFREVGIHRRHGRLDGEWRDVVVVERLLGDAAE